MADPVNTLVRDAMFDLRICYQSDDPEKPSDWTAEVWLPSETEAMEVMAQFPKKLNLKLIYLTETRGGPVEILAVGLSAGAKLWETKNNAFNETGIARLKALIATGRFIYSAGFHPYAYESLELGLEAINKGLTGV